MRCGITLLGDRVSPRCTAADGLMVVSLQRGHLTSCETLPVEISSPLDLLAELKRDERRKEVPRSHEQASRCKRCGFRQVCDQKVA